MKLRDRQTLIEAVVGAFRGRRTDGSISAAPEWFDLDDAGRDEAFQEQLTARQLEQSADGELSTTGRCVVDRAMRLDQLTD